jgi:hypothetical protein
VWTLERFLTETPHDDETCDEFSRATWVDPRIHELIVATFIDDPPALAEFLESLRLIWCASIEAVARGGPHADAAANKIRDHLMDFAYYRKWKC